MTPQIIVNGSWINGQPTQNGQRYRLISQSGVVIESYWSVPEQNMKMTKLGFKQRFTAQERIDIRAAAAQNPVVFDFQDLLDSATYVDISRQDTIDAINQLEQFGLIGEGRATEILSPPVLEIEQYNG